MYYYIIAGERSGDLHASNLMKEIKLRDPNATFRFWGGEYMQAVGGEMVTHYKEMSYMGFLEVLLNLDKVLSKIKLCKKDIVEHKPDVLILVDYSGFNLKIAEFVKKQGLKVPVFYYISPKVWAWNTGRANKIKVLIDRMFVILPFEKEFYKKFNYAVDYVGNPSIDAYRQFKPNPNFRKENNLGEKPIIAVLPGSRKEEVNHMLHFMISILPAFRDYQFVVAGVSNLNSDYYEAFKRDGIVAIVYEQTYDILNNAKAALVTSGTATLETALFEVPQVVCYATSTLTYMAAQVLVKVKYISLVNLIADEWIVRELLQGEFSPSNLMEELLRLTGDEKYREQIMAGYKRLKVILGDTNASANTAELMLKYLKK
jgi:lipid-A-disaccharide synthase